MLDKGCLTLQRDSAGTCNRWLPERFFFNLFAATCNSLLAICEFEETSLKKPYRFVYITAKMRRFRISLGLLMFREKNFSLIKPASLTRKRRVFAGM